MKTFKNFALFALLLGSFAAFAGKNSHRANKLYANTGGSGTSSVWVDITGKAEDASFPYDANTYRCAADNSQSCTVELDELDAAPEDGTNPMSAIVGDYIAQ